MSARAARAAITLLRTAAPVALCVLTPGVLLAHPGEPIAPHDVWSTWSFEPGVLVALALLVGVYTVGVRRLWKQAGAGRGISRRRVGLFGAGVLALLVALVSPLDRLGVALFSFHMVQHMVLVLVAAPLLIVGAVETAVLWALPLRARRSVTAWWLHSPRLRAGWAAFTLPLVVWLLHALALWLWHIPALYEPALRREWIHALEHASFFGTALLFWWVVARPSGRARLVAGAGVLFVFTTMMHSGVLGALITFSSTPWYVEHAAAAAAWGITPMDDQQIAGLVMWVPGGLVYLGATLWLLWRWLESSEAPVQSRAPRAVTSNTRSAAGAALLLLITLLGCFSQDRERMATVVPGGDHERGRALVSAYGCGSCHRIPGIAEARGTVGPPLANMAHRTYIAGTFPNRTENMVAWIQAPQAMQPGTAMPDLGVSESDARHIAAYLYTLR